MRVAHVNLARGFRGGERQTALLVRELASRGISQRLVVRWGGDLAPWVADVPGLEIRYAPWPYLPFVKLVGDPDLIHSHDGKSPVWAALSGTVTGRPWLITRRIQPAPGDSPITRAAYGRAAALVGLSEGVRKTLARYTGRDDVAVVPSALAGLPVDPNEVARIRERYRDRFLVVCAAALVEKQKGQSFLIEAVRTLAPRWPELHVLLLGEGSSRDVFEARARDVPQVELPGFVHNLGDYLEAADAFVLPSLHEGLGSVLLDAFHAGLPVIATRIAGVRDVVRHGENGLLVPPADPAALADALRRLRDDAPLRDRLARAARASAEDYTPARMADRYLAVYRRVLGGEGRP